MIHITEHANLAPFHTFGINTHCDFLVEAHSVDDLLEIYQKPEWQTLPKLPLGTGSNTLFVDHFAGVVVLNRLKGREVTEDAEFYYLECAAGEDWPELVEWTIDKGLLGLENLAMIPGCVGTAPIQNIGAYGVELVDVCEFVEYLDLDSLELKHLKAEECAFGYRDSVFKGPLKGKALITKVGLKLRKQWHPHVEYGALKKLIEGEVTGRKIFDAVSEVRQSKLPDPRRLGNAGSFFKNPLVSREQFERLKGQYPGIVGYETDEGVKLAAGWLIDNAGLKQYTRGGAMVHEQQALVIVNQGGASAADVIAVAQHVTDCVNEWYQVALEHEVRFIGACEETNLAALQG